MVCMLSRVAVLGSAAVGELGGLSGNAAHLAGMIAQSHSCMPLAWEAVLKDSIKVAKQCHAFQASTLKEGSAAFLAIDCIMQVVYCSH